MHNYKSFACVSTFWHLCPFTFYAMFSGIRNVFFWIPDLGSTTHIFKNLETIFLVTKKQCGGSDFFLHPGSRIRIKEFKCFNPNKWFLSSRKYDPGCSSRIPDPDADFYSSRIPDPGVKKALDPGSGSATLLKSTIILCQLAQISFCTCSKVKQFSIL